jgi:hypothetical protein
VPIPTPMTELDDLAWRMLFLTGDSPEGRLAYADELEGRGRQYDAYVERMNAWQGVRRSRTSVQVDGFDYCMVDHTSSAILIVTGRRDGEDAAETWAYGYGSDKWYCYRYSATQAYGVLEEVNAHNARTAPNEGGMDRRSRDSYDELTELSTVTWHLHPPLWVDQALTNLVLALITIRVQDDDRVHASAQLAAVNAVRYSTMVVNPVPDRGRPGYQGDPNETYDINVVTEVVPVFGDPVYASPRENGPTPADVGVRGQTWRVEVSGGIDEPTAQGLVSAGAYELQTTEYESSETFNPTHAPLAFLQRLMDMAQRLNIRVSPQNISEIPFGDYDDQQCELLLRHRAGEALQRDQLIAMGLNPDHNWIFPKVEITQELP